MTMILTCLTRDFIAQASDRRLTRPINGKIEVCEDQSNKALIYGKYFVFAYTGIAQLMNTKNTIDWAAQVLSDKENLQAAIPYLNSRLSDLMENFYSRDRKKLAFVGAGFAHYGELGRTTLRPLRVVVSNFKGGNDTWLSQPYKGFKFEYEPLRENHDFALLVAGQQLSEERKQTLNDLIKRCLKHKKGPETIGRLLAREIQKTASSNEYVGKNIMCTFVPRNTYTGPGIKYHFGAVRLENPVISNEPQILRPVDESVTIHERFALPPPFDAPRFVYIRDDDRAFPYEGPIYVVPGKVIPPMTWDGAEITVPPFTHDV